MPAGERDVVHRRATRRNCEFVLQIGTEEKAGLAWGDDGIAYIARRPGGGRDAWYLTWQSL